MACVRRLSASVSCGSGGGAFFGVAFAITVVAFVGDVSVEGGCAVYSVGVVLVGGGCCCGCGRLYWMNVCASGMMGEIISSVGGVWNGFGVLVGGGFEIGMRGCADGGLRLYCCVVFLPGDGGTYVQFCECGA